MSAGAPITVETRLTGAAFLLLGAWQLLGTTALLLPSLLAVYLALLPVLVLALAHDRRTLVRLGACAVRVDLPDAQAESLTVPEDPPTLQILADGSYKLNGEVVDEAALAAKVQELLAAKPDQMVLVNGDAKVPYQFVAQGMAILHGAGANKIGFVTEPAEANAPKR